MSNEFKIGDLVRYEHVDYDHGHNLFLKKYGIVLEAEKEHEFINLISYYVYSFDEDFLVRLFDLEIVLI